MLQNTAGQASEPNVLTQKFVFIFFLFITDVLILSELMEHLKGVLYKFGKLDLSHYVGTGWIICFGSVPSQDLESGPKHMI